MRYLFLIKAPGYNGEVLTTDISNFEFQTTIICSSSFEKILANCVEKVSAGVQVVELCGGFTVAQARHLQESVGETAAVGHVQFNELGMKKLRQLGF